MNAILIAEERDLVLALHPKLPKDARCETCEYFDIGIMNENGESDCLNSQATKFQRFKDEVCKHYFNREEAELDVKYGR